MSDPARQISAADEEDEYRCARRGSDVFHKQQPGSNIHVVLRFWNPKLGVHGGKGAGEAGSR